MNQAEAGRLLARYLDGELSRDERRRLMDVILSDQDLYNAFAEESILAEMLEDPAFRAKVNAAVQAAPGIGERLAGFFRSLNAGLRVAAVSAAIALVLTPIVLVIYRAGHRGQDVVARGGVPPTRLATHPETPVVPTPVNPPVNPKAKGPAVKSVSGSGALALATLTLVPIERDAAKHKNVLVIRHEPAVRLRIDLGKDSYATYSAVLASVDTEFKQTFDHLKPRGHAGARQLALTFPSNLLRAGDYTVMIYGLNNAAGASGSARPGELAGGYSFSVKEDSGY